MYKHSNELEEVGIASLSGVNVESNPEMESLFGVSDPSFCYGISPLTRVTTTETVLLYSVHGL
jgi:hypothetical protein